MTNDFVTDDSKMSTIVDRTIHGSVNNVNFHPNCVRCLHIALTALNKGSTIFEITELFTGVSQNNLMEIDIINGYISFYSILSGSTLYSGQIYGSNVIFHVKSVTIFLIGSRIMILLQMTTVRSTMSTSLVGKVMFSEHCCSIIINLVTYDSIREYVIFWSKYFTFVFHLKSVTILFVCYCVSNIIAWNWYSYFSTDRTLGYGVHKCTIP